MTNLTKQDIQERIEGILKRCNNFNVHEYHRFHAKRDLVSLISDVVKEVVTCKPEKQLEKLKELTQ